MVGSSETKQFKTSYVKMSAWFNQEQMSMKLVTSRERFINLLAQLLAQE